MPISVVAVVSAGFASAVLMSRRRLALLYEFADATTRLSRGEVGARPPQVGSPAATGILELVNRMVDSLQWRIDREHRLFGDVGHELRTSLNMRTTGVDVRNRHEEDSPPPAWQALELVAAQVYGLLDGPFALARVEAGLDHGELGQLSDRASSAHALGSSRHPGEPLAVNDDVAVFGGNPEVESAVVAPCRRALTSTAVRRGRQTTTDFLQSNERGVTGL